MKKLILISFALALLTPFLALAQDTAKPDETKQDSMQAEKASAKAVSLSGKISADGKAFVDKDNKSWTVSNPEALKGHEGHEVTLKAHVDAAKSEIHIVSLKMVVREWSQLNLLITLVSHSDEGAVQDLIHKLLSSGSIGLAATP